MAETCRHVASDKMDKFPLILEHFADEAVIKECTSAASTAIAEDEGGIRLNPNFTVIETAGSNYFINTESLRMWSTLWSIRMRQFSPPGNKIGSIKINQENFNKMPQQSKYAPDG